MCAKYFNSDFTKHSLLFINPSLSERSCHTKTQYFPIEKQTLSNFLFSIPGYPVWVQRWSAEQARAREAVCHQEELRGLQGQERQDVVCVWRHASAGDQVWRIMDGVCPLCVPSAMANSL